MANEEHLAILKEGVEVWNKWREENVDIEPDLSNANLADIDLYSVNFFSTNLRSADLSDTKLISADLSFANLRSTDLSSANLNSANLSSADLHSANLSSADLSSANLFSTDLSFANLHKASFNSADLYETDLHETDLREANFSSANLRSTNIRSADLSSANFISAELYETDLCEAKANETTMAFTAICNIDLRNIKNLNTIIHKGPSQLSTGTFKKSEGNIPEEFLKGVGLDDWEIESVKLYNPNLTPSQITDIQYKVDELRNSQPIQLYPVFLSHSWKDKAFVRRLYDALDKRGVRCWLDEKQMDMGTKLIKGINQGIRVYDKLILICSEASLTSWWVERELERILEKERSFNNGKKTAEHENLLIPLTLDDYVFNGWDGHWKTEVVSHVVGDARGAAEDDGKFEQVVDGEVKALRVGGREDRPPSFLPKR